MYFWIMSIIHAKEATFEVTEWSMCFLCMPHALSSSSMHALVFALYFTAKHLMRAVMGTRIVDPHWFQCWSGSSLFLSQCGFESGSGSRKPIQLNPCKSGSGPWSDIIETKSWIFCMKNIQVKKQTYKEQSLFERKEARNLCGSGSRSGSTTLMGTTYVYNSSIYKYSNGRWICS